ncbi:hypothetical protein [Chitinophaga qingshengii]|uniref:Uncharacterized protein n=1 Tax=Chitinophaga qingshengii TaxID=1569794 RepID=A0ABR7TTM9_9BACT|nr:hypothetical protein [Chitinophaga qingshengii]MBC9932801.1 hypothetical protein [Chitinophaga qingshengii]
MKKLEKLVPKAVTSPEALKGGLMQLQCMEDGDKTSSNSASWNGRHYVTDTKAD